MKKQYRKPERAPSHAGSVLKSGFIEQYGLRVDVVASLLGLSRVHLSRIINAHAPVTPEIAIRLEALTRTPASQWLALQAKYDAYVLGQQKTFWQYSQALEAWLSNSILQKKGDSDAVQSLVAQASLLARQIGIPRERRV